jgi:phenylalanyl-tRNA synthetase beta chain
MKVSYRWLCRYFDVEPDSPSWPNPETIEATLTSIGLEVEEVQKIGRSAQELAGLVIGRVMQCVPHPNADRLKLTLVNVGLEEPLAIVCGAPNVTAGMTVVVAPVGSTLHPFEGPELLIRTAKIRGESSQGMLCAEDEIGLSNVHDGLMVLPDDWRPGASFAAYYGDRSDTIYTLGITPNRMDALSHYGVARDVGAALSISLIPLRCLCREDSAFDADGNPLSKEMTMRGAATTSTLLAESDVKPGAGDEAKRRISLSPRTPSPMTLRVETGLDCPRLAGLTIEAVSVGPSPDWLQEALRSIGQKPINNIVDVTNYIQFELGQPLHAYDRTYLQGNLLGVRQAKVGEKITLLDQKEYTLSPANLVIEDGEKPVGLAGVMGGAGDSIHPHTISIYLECACFDPIRIRRSARSVGLRSEASYRFERGTDPALVPLALERAASLILSTAGGFIPYRIDYLESATLETSRISMKHSALERIAGCPLPVEETKRILKSLDFIVKDNDSAGADVDLTWDIKPPFYRRDVRRQADVAEEILRIWGYDRIPIPNIHRYRNDYPEESGTPVWQERISDWLSARGFSEFMGLSFVSQEEFEAIEPDLSRAIRVLGPVNEQIPFLRPSLILSGLRHIAHNLNRRQNTVLCYEFGRTYLRQDIKVNFEERESLCIMVTGSQVPETWYRSEQPVDLPFLRGHVADLFRFCNSAHGKDQPWSNSGMQPISQGVQSDDVQMLQVGRDLLDLFDIKQPVFCAVLPWTEWIPKKQMAVPAYRDVPKFPAMRRDLALVMPISTPFRQIEQLARAQGGPYLESLQLFDVYNGKGLPQGHISYAISLIFRHPEQTLTDSQIEETIQAMLVTFDQSLGAKLRQ